MHYCSKNGAYLCLFYSRERERYIYIYIYREREIRVFLTHALAIYELWMHQDGGQPAARRTDVHNAFYFFYYFFYYFFLFYIFLLYLGIIIIIKLYPGIINSSGVTTHGSA